MNPQTKKSLDQLLAKLERRSNRPKGRFTITPFVLAIALFVGVQLLIRLVPALWAEFLPGGLDQALVLRGWPGLIWRAALFCHYREIQVYLAIVGVFLVTLFLGHRLRTIRILNWLMSLIVILLDAGIIIVTLRTALGATAAQAGLPFE